MSGPAYDPTREAELSVLGSIMLDNAALQEAESAGLLASSFADGRNRIIFAAMQGLAQASKPIDPVTLLGELGRQATAAGGLDYLGELAAASASAVNIRHHAIIVRQAAQVRSLGQGLAGVVQKARTGELEVSDLVDQASAVLQAARDGRPVEAVTHQALLRMAIEAAHAAYKKPGQIQGIPLGFANLDGFVGGLAPGSLNILAARPSMGKTALAMNAAVNAGRAGRGVLFVSLEMPTRELAIRVLASEARVDGERIRSGHLSDADIDRLTQAVGARPVGLPIHWCDRATMSAAAIRAEAQAVASTPGAPPLGLVVVDYLQLVQGRAGGNKSRNREQEVSEISRDFKLLAKDLGVPVLLLSQLNRSVEQRANKRPMLSDLRESGAIEQDADLVMFVYRDDYYNEASDARGLAEVIVAKNRNGSTGTRVLKFFKQWTRFDDPDPDTGHWSGR